MKAVRLHGVGDLRVEEIAAPGAPGPGEVRVAVSVAGICGSDLHNFCTGAWISRAPSVAGHEFTGTVTAVGEGVTHVAPGQAVIVDSRVTCGTCRNCRAGLAQVCETMGFVGEAIDGGFAEAVILPGRNVIAAPAGVADRHLALAEPLAVALHALDRLDLPAGAPLAVAGCGPIGGLVALLAARRGHEVHVIDRQAARAALVAEAAGASVAALDALPAARHAMDATGAPGVIRALAEGLLPGGALGLVGIGHGALDLDPVLLVEKEMALVGCHAYGGEFERIGAVIAELGAALDPLIDAEIALEEVPAAYQRHLAGEVAGLKTLIRCGA
ncbi:zinc-binding dehydrogenase [Poseidonocella sp. HB161398]|uniref:zinc-dependent alcohol dehydrogenase n=1 Tax=Poseidonocella sp. HB161398 TaxID=2320855 RepID=UPI001109C909|nr:alcohol dehydrogenase catalytic domain-containing protein [Poseidonocella sp. HB161398]